MPRPWSWACARPSPSPWSSSGSSSAACVPRSMSTRVSISSGASSMAARPGMKVEKDETIGLKSTDDVVRVRQLVRACAIDAGFGLVDQTKIITAASEIARNAVDYGGGGTVKIEVLRNGAHNGVRLTVEDNGPGIADIALAMK